MAITLVVEKENKMLFLKNHKPIQEEFQIRSVVWKSIQDHEVIYGLHEV